MMRLLGALGHSTGSSLAMLLGESASAASTTELGDPASIADATFQLLTTLTKKASDPTLVLKPLYHYLSSCKNLYIIESGGSLFFVYYLIRHKKCSMKSFYKV